MVHTTAHLNAESFRCDSAALMGIVSLFPHLLGSYQYLSKDNSIFNKYNNNTTFCADWCNGGKISICMEHCYTDKR